MTQPVQCSAVSTANQWFSSEPEPAKQSSTSNDGNQVCGFWWDRSAEHKPAPAPAAPPAAKHEDKACGEAVLEASATCIMTVGQSISAFIKSRAGDCSSIPVAIASAVSCGVDVGKAYEVCK